MTIQDRLRADVFYGEERMDKFKQHNPLHMQAADRIDALEKALRRLNSLTAHDAAIVAAALTPPPSATPQAE